MTMVSGSRETVLDEFVRLNNIIDLNSRFSGITPDDMSKKAVLDFEGIRRAIGALISPQTILVGHGLFHLLSSHSDSLTSRTGIDNDLRAMRLVHPADRVIDTAIVRLSLRYKDDT